jgi:peptide deformylase
MAILPILVYPNPLLKAVCAPVEEITEEILSFVADLTETMENAPGCVGIAAPQVGVLKRIIVVDASRNPKVTAHHGRQVLINPVIERQDGEVTGREGCLSLPHLTANVKRAQVIGVRALLLDGGQIQLEAADFEARVILHESDHLDGILFLDRVSSLKTDVFRRKTYAPGTGPP